MTFMVLYLGTYCLKVKGLIYKQLMFMPLTFKQVYHHLTSKVTLSTGAVKGGVKIFLKKRSHFYSQNMAASGSKFACLLGIGNKQELLRITHIWNDLQTTNIHAIDI